MRLCVVLDAREEGGCVCVCDEEMERGGGDVEREEG